MATHHFIRAKELGFKTFTEGVRIKVRDDIPKALATVDRIKLGDVVTVLTNNGSIPNNWNRDPYRMTYIHYPQGEFINLTDDTRVPDAFPIEHWDAIQTERVGLRSGLLVSIPTATLDDDRTGKITINGREWELYSRDSTVRVWYLNECLANGKAVIRRIPTEENRLAIFV
jgi:hypothetical protein